MTYEQLLFKLREIGWDIEFGDKIDNNQYEILAYSYTDDAICLGYILTDSFTYLDIYNDIISTHRNKKLNNILNG